MPSTLFRPRSQRVRHSSGTENPAADGCDPYLSHRRPMGDVMQQSFATVLTAALAALAMTGCGPQQPAPAVPSSQQSAPEVSSAASTAPLPSSSESASVAATASPSSELTRKIPTTGLPSAQFCEAGETYLAKFPGLPRVQPPKGAAAEPTTTRMCAYMAVIGDLSAPAATLGVMDWSGGSDEIPMMKRICTGDDELTPSVTKIDADWVQSRGWNGWTMTDGMNQQAMLCTDDHAFSAALINVPGATQEDALNSILAAVD